MLLSKARLCTLINSIVPSGYKKFMLKLLALLTWWGLDTRLFTVWCVFNGQDHTVLHQLDFAQSLISKIV